MTIKEIESAIIQLPVSEVAELTAWLNDFHHRIWDRQIEDDLESGRLDALLAEVENEYETGSATPL